jgi:hypothetical protein
LQHGFQCIQTANPLQKTASKRKARQNPAPRQTQHLIRQATAYQEPSKGKPSKRQASKPSTQARQAKNDRQGFSLMQSTKKSKANPASLQSKKAQIGLLAFQVLPDFLSDQNQFCPCNQSQ